MRLTPALVFTLLMGVGQAQLNAPLQPTPLEAFVRQPSARLAWSTEVGRIDTRQAHATVTAVIVEDTAQPPDRMRGIRIELSDKDRNDEVYLGEETLVAYRNALDEISREAARERDQGTARPSSLKPDGTAYVGACLFRYANGSPSVHALSASYYFAPDSSGLVVSTFKGAGFRFPERDPSQLSAAIARAIDYLKEH